MTSLQDFLNRIIFYFFHHWGCSELARFNVTLIFTSYLLHTPVIMLALCLADKLPHSSTFKKNMPLPASPALTFSCFVNLCASLSSPPRFEGSSAFISSPNWSQHVVNHRCPSVWAPRGFFCFFFCSSKHTLASKKKVPKNFCQLAFLHIKTVHYCGLT